MSDSFVMAGFEHLDARLLSNCKSLCFYHGVHHLCTSIRTNLKFHSKGPPCCGHAWRTCSQVQCLTQSQELRGVTKPHPADSSVLSFFDPIQSSLPIPIQTSHPSCQSLHPVIPSLHPFDPEAHPHPSSLRILHPSGYIQAGFNYASR